MDLCKGTLCHHSLLQNAKFWRDQVGRKIQRKSKFPDFLLISFYIPSSFTYLTLSLVHSSTECEVLTFPGILNFFFRAKSTTQTVLEERYTGRGILLYQCVHWGLCRDMPFRSGLLAETCSFASGWNTHQSQMTLPGSWVAKEFPQPVTGDLL